MAIYLSIQLFGWLSTGSKKAFQKQRPKNLFTFVDVKLVRILKTKKVKLNRNIRPGPKDRLMCYTINPPDHEVKN